MLKSGVLKMLVFDRCFPPSQNTSERGESLQLDFHLFFHAIAFSFNDNGVWHDATACREWQGGECRVIVVDFWPVFIRPI